MTSLPLSCNESKPFTYISVCSGIEAATVAWKPLGWKAVAYAEIDKSASAVLAHHNPDVPNVGDFTKIRGDEYGAIDLMVGGTPCQDFSVAGLRAGMDGKRGQLTVEYALLAGRLRPRWLVWENVPGVLSIDGGRAFGTFLGLLGQLGYGFAYRVLDAQHFGVPQRRRRVFVVGHLGDWRRAAAVLFEQHSLSGDSAPRREAGQVAPTIPSRSLGGGGLGTDFDCDGGLDEDRIMPILDGRSSRSGANSFATSGGLIASTGDIAHCLNAGSMGRQDYETETLIAHSLRGEGFDASEDGTGRGTPLVPVHTTGSGYWQEGFGTLRGREQDSHESLVVYRTAGDGAVYEEGDKTAPLTTSTDPNTNIVAFSCKDHGSDVGEISPTLRSMGHDESHANAGGQVAVAFSVSENSNGFAWESDVNPTLQTRAQIGTGNSVDGLRIGMAVRRLTPRECERLQGFPDDYTLVRYHKVLKSGKFSKRLHAMADGPRYKMLGNSMAVPVMRWIGERIQAVEALEASV